MPVTPLHFGPAIALKAVAPAYFSLSVFTMSQVLIDLEPLFYMIIDEPPLRRFFHTCLGAGIICLICIIAGKPLGQWGIRAWNKIISPGHQSRLHGDDRITMKAAALAAVFGSFSHVFLDSLMHGDVHPLAPWSESNALCGAIDPLALHFGLFALGTVGAFWLVLMVLGNRFR